MQQDSIRSRAVSESHEHQSRTEDPRAFLQRLEPHRRGCDGGSFNLAVRAGCSTPAAIVASVTELARSRASDPAYQQLLRALQEHQAEALSYAAMVLQYESMPAPARAAARARRHESGALEGRLRSMAGKPSTSAQASLLRELGYSGEAPPDRRECSALIEVLLQQRRGVRR